MSQLAQITPGDESLPELHHDSTLADLPLHHYCVDGDTSGEEVVTRLREREELPGVIVVVGGGPLGAISRRRFLEQLSRPYSLDLYLKRPVRLLLEDSATGLLHLPGETRIDQAAQCALARPPRHAFEPLVVARPHGGAGLLDIHLLLRAQSRLLELTNRRRAELFDEVTGYAARLESALDDLRHTQEELAQASKMAALGELVAGVAHEINTPVGIGLTAATHLQQELDGLAALFEAGGMKRADLVRFLATAGESVGLITGNLRRAAELVRSFKRVAVDHTSEERRRFRLGAYLEEVLRSLGPQLKRRPLRVEVACDPALELDGYPGALWQVLSNLVLNSLAHGYGEEQGGTIRISAEARDGRLALRYGDDGAGVPEALLGRLFEPFFTTRRGRGGTGLGLHIVYNLITHTLGGRIECRRHHPSGLEFMIDIPITAPRHGEEEESCMPNDSLS